MASKGSGYDATGHGTMVLQGRRKGAAFQVTAFDSEGGGGGLGATAAAITGRELILKYVKVPAVPDWQLSKLMDFEVQQIAEQAGGELSADYNLLPVADEMTGEETILLALAKNEALDRLSKKVEAGGGSVQAYTPNAIAVYNAFLQAGPAVDDEDTVMVAWLGESTIDIVLMRGTALLFARNVSGGLSTLDGAIAQTFNVRDERARRIRNELLNLDPRARGNYGSSQEEKVAHAVQGVAGQLQAALRSTLAFCQSQTNIQDLQLTQIHVCGPGAKVKGIIDFLSQGLGSQVAVFDPVQGLDLSACDPEGSTSLEDAGPECAVALGLALAQCFDELYLIEILPEAVKKKQRFVQRTFWNLAAILLALVYLAWSWSTQSAAHEDYSKNAGRIASKANQAARIHKEAEALHKETVAMAAQVSALEELAVPHHGTAKLFRAFREVLPEEFWIEKVETARLSPTWVRTRTKAKARSRGPKVRQRAVVTYQGKGNSAFGGDPARQVYPAFVKALEPRVPFMIKSPKATTPFEFSGTVDFLYVEPVEDPEAEDEEGEER